LDAKLAELDRLLNDPEQRFDPERVWVLAAQLAPSDAMAAPRPNAVAQATLPSGIGVDSAAT
jgi:hypothetical protein